MMMMMMTLRTMRRICMTLFVAAAPFVAAPAGAEPWNERTILEFSGPRALRRRVLRCAGSNSTFPRSLTPKIQTPIIRALFGSQVWPWVQMRGFSRVFAKLLCIRQGARPKSLIHESVATLGTFEVGCTALRNVSGESAKDSNWARRAQTSKRSRCPIFWQSRRNLSGRHFSAQANE